MSDCDPRGFGPPGSSVHGILQAKILEWIAIPFSRASSQPRKSNPGLLHGRQILYHLSHQGSPDHTLYAVIFLNLHPKMEFCKLFGVLEMRALFLNWSRISRCHPSTSCLQWTIMVNCNSCGEKTGEWDDQMEGSFKDSFILCSSIVAAVMKLW